MTDQAIAAQKPSGVWSAGVFAAALAVIANIVILFFTKPLAPALMPLNVAPVVIWTIIGAVGATALYNFLAGRSATASRTFIMVAVIALLVSFTPDVMLLANPNPMFGQVTAAGVYSLMAMHVAAAAIIVPTLIQRSR